MLKSLFLTIFLFVASTLLIVEATFSSPLPLGTLFIAQANSGSPTPQETQSPKAANKNADQSECSVRTADGTCEPAPTAATTRALTPQPPAPYDREEIDQFNTELYGDE